MKRVEHFFGYVVAGGIGDYNLLKDRAFWEGGRELEKFLDRAWDLAKAMEAVADDRKRENHSSDTGPEPRPRPRTGIAGQ